MTGRDRTDSGTPLAPGEWIDNVPLFACKACKSPLGVYKVVGPLKGEWQRCAACGSTDV